MPLFLQTHPLAIGALLILLDLALWHFIDSQYRTLRIAVRLLIFAAFSGSMTMAGISPLQPAPWPDDAFLNLVATALGIGWWLFAARTLTVLLGNGLMGRDGHSARLLYDLMGAAIFLVAIVAATAYVLQLPVKGLLATSGFVAIGVGLALRTTLGDVLSGIVLNTTKPYQLDDWIAIDGIEGKVMEIDWRSTHLMTGQGSLAILPNSLIAKTRILNYSRPGNAYAVSVVMAIPSGVRPRQAIEALERALQGTRDLLPGFSTKVSLKSSHLEYNEYELKGYVGTMGQKNEVCNLMFDLAHRHLEASGITWWTTAGAGKEVQPWSRQRRLLEEARIFRSLSKDAREQLANAMVAVEYQADEVILALNEVANCLMIISTGVISASIHDGEQLIEAVRLGPGEVMGEEGILAEGRSRAEFRSITSGRLYRIDRSLLGAQLDHQSELKVALNKLQHQREGIRSLVVMKKPEQVRKGGLLRWLRWR